MAAPTYHETTISRADGSSITVDFPATVNADDLLIVCIMVDADNAGTNTQVFTENTTTDFTHVGSSGSNAVDCYVNVFQKVADGTEDGGSVTFDSSEGTDEIIAFCIRVSGVDTTTPIYTTATTASNPGGNSTSFAASVAATDRNDSMAFYAAAFDGGDGDPFSVSGTGWTELAEGDSPSGSTSGNDVGGSVGNLTQATAGTPAQPTIASSASDGHAVLYFVVQPPAPPTVHQRTTLSEADGDVAAYKTEGKTATSTGTGAVASYKSLRPMPVMAGTGSVDTAYTKIYVTHQRTATISAAGDVDTIKSLRPMPVMAGSGEVTASYFKTHVRAATVTGSGDVTTYKSLRPMPIMAGAGDVTTARTKIFVTYQRTATIAGNGDVTAYKSLRPMPVLAGTGNVATTYTKFYVRAATISADGDVTSYKSLRPMPVMAGVSTLTGNPAYPRTSTISAEGDVTSYKSLRPMPVLAGAGSVTTARTIILATIRRTSTISGSGDVASYKTLRPSATISGSGSATSTRTIILTAIQRTATVSGAGSITSLKSLRPMPVISSTGAMSGQWTRTYFRLASVAGSGELAAHPTYPRTASVSATGAVTSVKTLQPTSTSSGTGSVTTARTIVLPTIQRSATVSATGSVSTTFSQFTCEFAVKTADDTVYYAPLTAKTSDGTSYSVPVVVKTADDTPYSLCSPTYLTPTVTSASGNVDAAYTKIVFRTVAVSGIGAVVSYKTLRPPLLIAADGDVNTTSAVLIPRTATINGVGSVSAVTDRDALGNAYEFVYVIQINNPVDYSITNSLNFIDSINTTYSFSGRIMEEHSFYATIYEQQDEGYII
jgi:hypothetical protein